MNIKELVDAQRIFFNSGKSKDVAFRITQLKKLKTILNENEDLLYKSVYSDFKKSEFDTYASELLLVHWEIDEAIKKIHKWAKRKRVRTNLPNLPGRSYIIPEPLGVSLVIGAWNYPYQLSLGPIVPSIAAGNTVILKPSEIAPSSSSAISKLINENFEKEYFTVVEGGIPETTELLNQKFDKIFFTGSTAVGKIVYQAAAKYLTPVTLELGGKSPAFITSDSHLDKAAKRIIWGKFLNAGQTCIAPDYLVVHENIKDKFLEKLKNQIAESKYSIENKNYTQIINDKNFSRLIKLIEKDKIYFGGNYSAENRFIEPTILNDINFDDEVMQDEIFGPVLPVISYKNLDDVISKIKSRPKPLSCYIFTDNANVKEKILRELSFGAGTINDAVMHISNPYLPFGGVGDSGTGSYHGENGFKAFSHYKSILEKSFWFEPDLKYSPYTEKKLKWIKKLFG